MNGRRKLTMWCLATIVAAGPLGSSSRAGAVTPADVVIPGSVALSVTTPSGVPGLCCKYELTVLCLIQAQGFLSDQPKPAIRDHLTTGQR